MENRPKGRSECIRDWKAGGGKIAAVFPIHYPRALLKAAGLLPVEVWGPPGVDTRDADAHLQGYVCDIVRRGLGFLLSGNLAECDILLVPHGCDSLQGLGSLLMDFIRPEIPVLTFYPPRSRGMPAVEYCRREIERLAGEIESRTGSRIDVGEWKEQLALDARIDEKISELWLRRPEMEIGNAELYNILASRTWLPACEFLELLDHVLSATKKREPAEKRIALSGIIPEPRGLLDVFDRHSVAICYDHTCYVGRRLYGPEGQDPPALAEARRMLSAPADVTLGATPAGMASEVVERAFAAKCEGVLVVAPKFCEPELFAWPAMKRRCDEAGLKAMLLEVELTKELSARDAGRLEAMLETL